MKKNKYNNNCEYFDHDLNGFAEKTSWVDANDGVLSYDRNNNGINLRVA